MRECAQKTIADEHGSLLSEIESQKAQATLSEKWVAHAKAEKACKICRRPFDSDQQCLDFQKRFKAVLCAPSLPPF